jgi:hypothetical protein
MSIFDHFQNITLSQSQEIALRQLHDFLAGPANVFMLKGYAGTGKTTLLKGLAVYLHAIGTHFALMAPTGRSAKVIRDRTGYEAYTIHKSIYCFDEMEEVQDGESFYYSYKIRNNDDIVGTVFIVDEASMISDSKNEGDFFRFGTSHLLSDLITYSRLRNDKAQTKIIFVGDPCQLPPIGDNSSKAFDATYLESTFGLSSIETELKEVIRHSSESGILNAASKLRKSITTGMFNNFNLGANERDIFNPTPITLLDTWDAASDPKIVIAYKNKTCLDLNLQIREHRFGKQNLPLQKSDIVIMGGNNYRKGFFNGEFSVVNDVAASTETRSVYLRRKDPVTLVWRDIQLIFPDTDGENKIVKGKVLENFITGENHLTPDELQALYVDFKTRHSDLKPHTKQFKEAIIEDEYFNCLLIKYGYAVTCHKAQGGEWDSVLTVWDHGTEYGKTNANFYRWAYTAITRASKTLYAFEPPSFNSYASMGYVDAPVLDGLQALTVVQQEADEVTLDESLKELLSRFQLVQLPLQIQDHFIRVHHAFGKRGIVITGWVKKVYEIQFTLSKDNDYARVKTYVNGNNEFNSQYSIIPKDSPGVDFNSTLLELLNKLPTVSIIRDGNCQTSSTIVFEFDQEERYPCLRELFDDISQLFLGTDIQVKSVEHMRYQERYTFNRNQDKVVFDFGYNDKCFFGRVVPLINQSTNPAFVVNIMSILQRLTLTKNAI